jgi:hypothetical protein
MVKGKDRYPAWCSPALVAGIVGALFVALPSATRAGCGDYVIRSGHAPGTPAKNNAREAEDSSNFAQMPHRHELPGRTPCQGPWCSRGTPTAPIPTSWLTVGLEEWGCTSTSSFIIESRATTALNQDIPVGLFPYEQTVFHPPRSSF